jgi:hypothetical protein
MTSRRRWLAGLAALTLAVLVSGMALGYAGEVAASVTVARPSGTVKCGVNLTITATVRDATGKRISGQPVTWSWVSRVTGGDKILVLRSTTNSKGVAKTTVRLACVPGSRVIRATADGVRGRAVLNVTAAGLPRTNTAAGSGGTPALPSTSTLANVTPSPADPFLGTLLALLALAAGGVLVLRGARARR